MRPQQTGADIVWERIKICFFEPLGVNQPTGSVLILNGLGYTLAITFGAVLIGAVLGVLVAMMRASDRRLLRWPAMFYIECIRGTPVLVQLFIINFVIFASVAVDKWLVAVIAFGVNSGAYISEIVRAGINAVAGGQMKAALSLGMTRTMAMRCIVLPQAFKNILPALGNEFIVLLKETSVVGFIGGIDLMRAGDILRSKTYDAVVPLFAVAAIYLFLTVTLSQILQYVERRLAAHD